MYGKPLWGFPEIFGNKPEAERLRVLGKGESVKTLGFLRKEARCEKPYGECFVYNAAW